MELVPCVHSLDPGLLPDGLLQPARQRGPGWRGLEDLLWAGQSVHWGREPRLHLRDLPHRPHYAGDHLARGEDDDDDDDDDDIMVSRCPGSAAPMPLSPMPPSSRTSPTRWSLYSLYTLLCMYSLDTIPIYIIFFSIYLSTRWSPPRTGAGLRLGPTPAPSHSAFTDPRDNEQ